MQPGDANGPPEQVVNCRCVTVGVLAGFNEAWKGKVYPEYAKEITPDVLDAEGLDGTLSEILAGSYAQFNSEKTVDIINKQKPMNPEVIKRVKESLLKKGTILDQSVEIDKYLESRGKEGITYSDGTIIMHTKVSASGFFEELIHYGQIKNGRAIYGDERNTILMEIEAKEKLIRNKKSYDITDYEIEILTDSLNWYKNSLDILEKGGA